MTAIVWHIGHTETTVATDTRNWRSIDDTPGDLSSKMIPLGAFNAVIAGGTWGYMMAHVTARVIGLGFRDLDDLKDGLPHIINNVWKEFRERAEDYDFDPDLCVIWLLGPGCAWLYSNDRDFQPIKLPEGLWCDPDIAPNGSCKVGEAFRGDEHLVDIMRRQREKRARPSGYPIGGPVTRARISRDGIALAQIGDLEADAQPVEPARKVGRNEPCPCGSGRKAKRCCQA